MKSKAEVLFEFHNRMIVLLLLVFQLRLRRGLVVAGETSCYAIWNDHRRVTYNEALKIAKFVYRYNSAAYERYTCRIL